MSEGVVYKILSGIIALVAGYIVYQTSRLRQLEKEKVIDELEKDNLEIEKKVSAMDDNSIKRELDKLGSDDKS